MSKKQSLKINISFKENIRDIEIYTFLNETIKEEIGISSYIKQLVYKDMESRKEMKNKE